MPLAAGRGPRVPQSRQGPSPEARSPPHPSLPLGRGVLYGLTGWGGHLLLSGWGTRPPARRAGTEHPAHGGRAGGRGRGACPSRGERPVSPSSSAHSRCEQTHVCETLGAGPQPHTRAHTHTHCLVLGAWPQSPALSGPRRCPGAPGESLQGLELSRAPPRPPQSGRHHLTSLEDGPEAPAHLRRCLAHSRCSGKAGGHQCSLGGGERPQTWVPPKSPPL